MTQGIQTQRHTAQPMDTSSDPAQFISNTDSQGVVAPPPKPPTEQEQPQQPSTRLNIPAQETEKKQQDSTSTQENAETTSNTSVPTLEELEIEEQLQAKQRQEKESQKQETTDDTPDFDFELPDDKNAQKFKEAFNKYLGFDVSELKEYAQQYRQAMTQIQTIQNQNYIRESINNLSNDWGVSQDEANYRLEEVKKRFATYSPQMQARLDNVEGAKLIWSRIENDNLTKKRNIPNFNSSNRNTTNRRTNNTQRMFTQAQIDAMSASEYNANYQDILFAYQNGLVSS